jgi:hypothetical protein
MKRLWWLLPIALVIALSGCFGPEGDLYLSFDWNYTPDSFYSDDYNMPSTIYRNTDYWTVPGDYYLSYYVTPFSTQYYYYIYYTLEAHRGFLFLKGKDARFQLYLWGYSGATLTQLQSIAGRPQGELAPAEDASKGVAKIGAPADTANCEQKQLYQYEETQGAYTLKVRGGIWVPKE